MISILIGSVNSTNIVLQEMMSSGFPISLVFSLESKKSDLTGYFPLYKEAKKHNIPFKKFNKINDEENVSLIRDISPDYIFVIGLSQIIGSEIIDCARKGVIGIHPTALPKYRGRAAIPWQILLGVRKSKVTMFFIDEGMDSGDIIDSEKYSICRNDYASDVEDKSSQALIRLSKRVLNNILHGSITSKKQNHKKATYLLKRLPSDGLIDWKINAKKIQLLIQAVSHPYPGAYTYYDGKVKVKFWRSRLVRNRNCFGQMGQISMIKEENIHIYCGKYTLIVTEYTIESDVKITVGHRFIDKLINY